MSGQVQQFQIDINEQIERELGQSAQPSKTADSLQKLIKISASLTSQF